MSQKANLQTIRKTLRTTNLLTLSPIEFLKGFNFLNYFRDFFRIKSVLINSSSLNFIGNKIQLSISLFACTAKLKKFTRFLLREKNKRKSPNYKKKLTFLVVTKKSNNSIHKKKFNKLLSTFILKELKFLGVNILVLKLVLLNKYCLTFRKHKFLRFLYLQHKNFKDFLFARRNNLFFDLLKITFLFSKGLITPNLFLFVLSQTFKILPKRKHARFLLLIKKLLKTLVSNNTKQKNTILGLKLLILGKLKGKLRTQKSSMGVGKIGMQTISKNIDYAKMHVFTRYGTFGFKFWVSRH